MAELWLLVAMLERESRWWHLRRARAMESTRNEAQRILDPADLFSSQVESTDLGAFRASLQEAASRLDNRTIAIATAASALAALAGAAVGSIG